MLFFVSLLLLLRLLLLLVLVLWHSQVRLPADPRYEGNPAICTAAWNAARLHSNASSAMQVCSVYGHLCDSVGLHKFCKRFQSEASGPWQKGQTQAKPLHLNISRLQNRKPGVLLAKTGSVIAS